MPIKRIRRAFRLPFGIFFSTENIEKRKKKKSIEHFQFSFSLHFVLLFNDENENLIDREEKKRQGNSVETSCWSRGV